LSGQTNGKLVLSVGKITVGYWLKIQSEKQLKGWNKMILQDPNTHSLALGDLNEIRKVIREEIKKEMAELFKDQRGPDGCWTLDGHGHTMLGNQWICER